MIVIPLLCSAVFLSVVWYQSDQQRSSHAVRCLWCALAFLASLLCLTSPIMALTTLLVGLVAAGCLVVNASTRSFRKAALTVTAISFVICGIASLDFKKIAQQRAQHPFESLSDRLAYETRAQQTVAGNAVSDEAGSRLTALETQLGTKDTPRVAELREIHQSYIVHFVNSEGFGVIRLLGKNSSKLFQTVAQSIALTTGSSSGLDSGTESKGEFSIRLAPTDYEDPRWVGEYRDPWSAGQNDSGKKPPTLPTPKDSFLQLHQRGLLDFVNRDSFGYVRDRDQVAGFRSHRFESSPSLSSIETTERWEIRRLDLVSLLKHGQPVAYITENLPNMNELRKVPMRSLDEIERAMLEQLQGGDDLQMRMTADRIRMLGAIRATKQCLDCHHVQRGDLLGAFSYRMNRQQ